MTDIEENYCMDDLLILISFNYPHEAHMAKGYLESNGIEILFKDEMTIQVNNFYSNAIGGIKLLVKKNDYENGIQLLKNSGYIKENTSNNIFNSNVIENIRTNDRKICPYCKSENIAKNRKLNSLIVIAYIILGLIFPIYRTTYKCFDCEKEWRFI